MRKPALAIVVVTCLVTTGCTLSHVAYVDPSYPSTQSEEVWCRSFADSFKSVAKNIQKEKAEGKKVVLVGYRHRYIFWGLALDSTIEVCYQDVQDKVGETSAGKAVEVTGETKSESTAGWVVPK